MKKARLVYGVAMGVGLLLSVPACGGNDAPAPAVVTFSYNAYLETPAADRILYKNEANKILISEVNSGDVEREYKFTSSNSSVLAVDDREGHKGELNPIKAGTARIDIKEKASGKKKQLVFTVRDGRAELINDGANYSADDDDRLEILGKLEKFAVDTHLTGITLFENGGYVRYANRDDGGQQRRDNRKVILGTNDYVTGYGFGLLTDGEIQGNLEGGWTVHPDYLHTASSSDPLTINAWDAQGSQVSDLSSYITSSYFGTKLKGTDETEWYPLLARDFQIRPYPLDSHGDPVPLQPDGKPVLPDADGNNSGLYRKWRIYVKTGTDETPENERVYYRSLGTGAAAAYENKPVLLEDYVFTFKLLLSQASKMFRGAELAGDTTYGIRGAQDFYTKTPEGTPAADINTLWTQYTDKDPETGKSKLGINWGVDAQGSYLEFDIINSMDTFTAMYTLSSSLYSPMKEAFLSTLGGGDFAVGASYYGVEGEISGSSSSIANHVLCVGSHILEAWEDTSYIAFATNQNWFEKNATHDPQGKKYRIPGVYIRTITEASTRQDAIYDHFTAGELDSTGIPQNKMSDKLDTDKETKGDSTFKLNVNSCTQEYWNYLFGDAGVIDPSSDGAYSCKPWMSNHNFIDGLSYAINRAKFASARGVQPSVNYFSDAYMSDPQHNVSYNGTQTHKDAIKEKYDGTEYGYSLDKARQSFSIALKQLTDAGKLEYGTSSNPTPITIDIMWMYSSDKTNYGLEIIGYLEEAFNHPDVCGNRVKLTVNQDAVQQWQDVYNKYLMKGRYDLGFGAISGNTYSPLNFLEVLKSDNSSNFTLNWGTDTNKIDKANPIEFDGKSWTFDALWAAGDHGTLAEQGRAVKPIKKCYLNNPIPTYTPEPGQQADPNKVYLGSEIEVPTTFVHIEPTTQFPDDGFVINQLSLYITAIGSYEFAGTDLKKRDGIYYIEISASLGDEINGKIVDKFDLDEEAAKPGHTEEEIDALLHPFTYANYNKYWCIDVYYTSTIKGVVTEGIETAKMTEDDVVTRLFSRLVH